MYYTNQYLVSKADQLQKNLLKVSFTQIHEYTLGKIQKKILKIYNFEVKSSSRLQISVHVYVFHRKNFQLQWFNSFIFSITTNNHF